MGITIGIKDFEYPQWVEDVYNCMSPKDRENNTKSNIYGMCIPKESGYEIIPFVCGLSNRIFILPEAKDVAIAIAIADAHYPWAFLPGQTIKLYNCKHCGFKFKSCQKDPQCPFCHQWEWSKP